MSINEIHFSSVDSTNNYLKENYESLDNLTFASTDYQSGGKGRNGRKWFSPSGENLLFSVLIKDLSYIDDPSLFSVFASVCVAKTLEELGDKISSEENVGTTISVVFPLKEEEGSAHEN